MNVGFACVTDVGSGYIAVLVLGFSAQDVFQIHLGSVQLLFGRSLAFGGKVCTAQCFVGQSAHCTGRTINHNRVLTRFANGNLVSQAEVDFVATYSRYDIFIFARVGYGFAQVDFVCIAVVGGNLQTFADFFAYFVQCILNGAYGFMFRAVRFGDGKGRCCNVSGGRINAGIQRFGYRVQLANVNRIGIVRTFGNLSNLVAAVIQTRLGQRHRIGTIGNGQTISRQYAVTCGNFRRSQSGSGQNAVANCYFVELNVFCSRYGNVLTVAGHFDVFAFFNGYFIIRTDFFRRRLFVHFQLPAFLGSLFH